MEDNLPPLALQIADGGEGHPLHCRLGLHQQGAFLGVFQGLDGFFHGPAEGCLLDGFEQEIDVLRLIDRGAVLHIARDEDHLSLGGAGEDPLGHGDAVVLAQQDVQDGDVRVQAPFHRCFQVLGRGEGEYPGLGKLGEDPILQALRHLGIVIAQYHIAATPSFPRVSLGAQYFAIV